jgi:dCTP deaminase
MAIKSDVWIKRMCREHELINPYEEKLVRAVGDRRIISAGLSSYGYDCRLARDEFKVFSPVTGTEIDPKNFDPNSLLDVPLRRSEDGSDYWLLPPHSYALGVTIERFKIPRTVTALAIGKSTYARCFSAGTRVALADGTSPTLEEMAERSVKGELFWGYSIGRYGRVMVTLLESPRYIGRDSLIEVTLDNGEPILCTPDHRFILRDGRTIEAGSFRGGESLMPLYRDLWRGYEMVYQPCNGFLYPTHRLADEWNLRNGVYEDTPGTHRHHLDHIRTNNNPWNIVRMDAAEHIRHHNEEFYGEDFDSHAHGEAIKAALAKLSEDGAWLATYKQGQQTRAVNFWTDPKYADARDGLSQRRTEYWSSADTRSAQRTRIQKFWAENEDRRGQVGAASKEYWARAGEDRHRQQREIAGQLNVRADIDEAAVASALKATGSIRAAARLLECDRSVFRRFPHVIQAFRGKNHKVVSVTEAKGEHDVYCLTVPESGNFALEAGVFVNNCGLMANTTPLEANWCGRLVVELYNAANLPVRLYAEEGFIQILFFESDEECETSYSDRGGKYQDQQGLTLAKV